jgi:hypothetical protein
MKEFAFAGGHEFQVQVSVVAQSTHYLGTEMEARNTERFVTYDIDGVPGIGISEWNYRNVSNKID